MRTHSFDILIGKSYTCMLLFPKQCSRTQARTCANLCFLYYFARPYSHRLNNNGSHNVKFQLRWKCIFTQNRNLFPCEHTHTSFPSKDTDSFFCGMPCCCSVLSKGFYYSHMCARDYYVCVCKHSICSCPFVRSVIHSIVHSLVCVYFIEPFIYLLSSKFQTMPSFNQLKRQ